ncbi:ABC transporter permease [Microlunatus flavus]|uniref:Peptide/nickel transport system permease protein n=1 Tax=Microlunatus flavus TaxID=1036181 RepID=A0A1H9KD59_9ACTN|nr:ABC transporter permease [Microlunatus flavus]SEQ96877.1 peptide/nickel transport system permease protein [Microlunatus flavus]
MLRFLVRRVLLGVLVLFLVVTLVFALFYLYPSDVARTLAGRQATPETIALIQARLGLDQPIYVQYGRFLWGLLHGNLGYDYYHQVPVTTIIAAALPKTLSIALGASVIWLVLGVLNGVVSAVRPRSVADRTLTVFSLFFYSLPTFVLGLTLLYFLYFKLTLAGVTFFPPGGYVNLADDPGTWFRSLILPWLTLALVQAALYTRLTRGSLIDVLGEDYIRTARSKGLGEQRITYRHGLRSALTPIVTQFGIDLGVLVGGVVVTESVFGIDGLGFEAVRAINDQNSPVIIGVVIVAAAAVVVANIVVDLLYAVLDPRVRLN